MVNSLLGMSASVTCPKLSMRGTSKAMPAPLRNVRLVMTGYPLGGKIAGVQGMGIKRKRTSRIQLSGFR